MTGIEGLGEAGLYGADRDGAVDVLSELEEEMDVVVHEGPAEDGEVVTAFQAACPTHAIVFGDINDAGSQVSQLKTEPHNYGVLSELGTRPRTTYLAKVRNPNPELEEVQHDGEEH